MSSGTTDSFPQLIGHIGGINARLAMILAPGREAEHISVSCHAPTLPVRAKRSNITWARRSCRDRVTCIFSA